jgi:uncharacterized membrane protein
MSNRTTEEILELARQRIADRKSEAIEERGKRETPWRYALFGLLGALLLGLIAWPGATVDWKMYAVVHGVCAQIHNVSLGGQQVPICARNTGIYSSFLVTSLYLIALGRGRAAKIPSRGISIMLLLFVVMMAIDGFNSFFRDMFLPHLYTPRNELRTLTGIGMGVSISVLLFLILNLSLRGNADPDMPVIKSWLELGGALVINFLVLLALYGNVVFMYWPIAISAWLGIIGVLFCVNLLLTSLAMGYEGRVMRVAQLAKPATIAVVLTGIELGLLSAGRFWLEQQGMLTL